MNPLKAFAVLPVLSAVVAEVKAEVAPYRTTLISVQKNQRVESKVIHGRKITPKAPAWSVQKRTLHGGKQEGVDVVTVNNGKLQFTVVPTRGMSVLKVQLGDVRLGWDSPVKEVVHPRHINLQSRGGLGWLEGFNEYMVRCGLESAGHPGTDKFINNVGDEATMELTLHGKIGNIPASEVELVVDKAPPYRIRLRGRVDERSFYGPKLELWTEISTVPGSSEFRISDTLTNRGAPEQEFQMIYHANYGKPLLGEGSVFWAPVKRVLPFNAQAAKNVDHYTTYAAPTPGFIENVYCLTPLGDAKGRTVIALANKARNRAVSMSFSVQQLPYVTLWKNTAGEGEGYVTGLEPGTGFPNNRRIERKYGRVPKLAPGAQWRSTIDYTIHQGVPAVKALGERIQALQGSTPPVIETQPENKD